MKKSLFLLLGALWCLAATDLSAQNEVRGVETRRVIYDGPTYYRDMYTEYYGFEFSNRNSIPVSVSIELWRNSSEYEDPILVTTKDVVLDPGEKYILKQEKNSIFWVHDSNSLKISDYYVKYKAYKLE